MKHLLLLAGAFVSYFVLASALKCYSKGLKASEDLLEQIECNGTQLCYKRIGLSPKHTFYSKGCLPSFLCNLIYTTVMSEIKVEFRTICCNTDLCNGGFPMRPSLLTGFFILACGWAPWHS